MPCLTIQLVDVTTKHQIATVTFDLSEVTEQAIRHNVMRLFACSPLHLDILFRSNPTGLSDLQMGRNATFALPVVQQQHTHSGQPASHPTLSQESDAMRCVSAIREVLDQAGYPIGASLNADIYRGAIEKLAGQNAQTEALFQQIRLTLAQAGSPVNELSDVPVSLQTLVQSLQDSQNQFQQQREEATIAQENLGNLRDAYGELQTRFQTIHAQLQHMQEENQLVQKSTCQTPDSVHFPKNHPRPPGAGRI